MRNSNADTHSNIQAAASLHPYTQMIYTPIPTEIVLLSYYFVLFILHFINKKPSLHLVPENTSCIEENLSSLVFFGF